VDLRNAEVAGEAGEEEERRHRWGTLALLGLRAVTHRAVLYDVHFRFERSPEGEDTWERIAPAYVALQLRENLRLRGGPDGFRRVDPDARHLASVTIRVDARSPIEAANEGCCLVLDAFAAAGREAPTMLLDLVVTQPEPDPPG